MTEEQQNSFFGIFETITAEEKPLEKVRAIFIEVDYTLHKVVEKYMDSFYKLAEPYVNDSLLPPNGVDLFGIWFRKTDDYAEIKTILDMLDGTKELTYDQLTDAHFSWFRKIIDGEKPVEKCRQLIADMNLLERITESELFTATRSISQYVDDIFRTAEDHIGYENMKKYLPAGWHLHFRQWFTETAEYELIDILKNELKEKNAAPAAEILQNNTAEPTEPVKPTEPTAPETPAQPPQGNTGGTLQPTVTQTSPPISNDRTGYVGYTPSGKGYGVYADDR